MALSAPSAPPTARQGAESAPTIRLSAVLHVQLSLFSVGVVAAVDVVGHVAGTAVCVVGGIVPVLVAASFPLSSVVAVEVSVSV